MTKTVFILTSESPERLGGVEHFVRDTVKGLELRGYKTEVFHRGNSEPRWLANPQSTLGKKIAGTLSGLWIGRKAQKHMGDHVAAVISNSDVGYYPLHRRIPIRRIHFYHGTYRAQSDAIRTSISRFGHLYLKWWSSMVLERFSGSGKTVLTCSDQVRDEVAKFFGHKAIAMWHPLDLERFKPADIGESRRKLFLPEGRPIGLFVGSTQPTKGFPMVQKLIRALPEIYWILALQGDLPGGLSDGPNLRIFRNLPHDQVPIIYSAASFSLCPSLYEGFGYVVAESLSCGTPVIAAPGGASRIFLKDHPFSRFLIENPNDFPSFQQAVREILAKQEYYREGVIRHIRPLIEDLMAPDNWWRRFSKVTDL
jgi:glycosyltransferase involved in cell wall biosynthesis